MRRISLNRSVFEWGYLALLGSFGFSMLGLHVVINILHFPFFFIEWLYIPIILKYGKRIAIKLKKVNIYQAIILLLLVFSFLYGFIYTNNLSSLTDYRSIIYLLVVYRFIKDEGIGNTFDDLLCVCFFAVLSELLFVAVFSDRRIVSSTNCLAAAMGVIGLIIRGRYKLGLVTFLLSLTTGILSGYRIGIVIPIISLLIACIYLVFQSENSKTAMKRIRKILYFFIGFLVLFVFMRHYEEIILFVSNTLHMDRFAVFRITTRMRGILQMDISQSQDTNRIIEWLMPFSDFFSSVLPHGFIRTRGTYIDIPVIILYDTVGSIAAWFVVFFFYRQTYLSLKIIHKKKNSISIPQKHQAFFSVCMMPIILCLLIINGTFIMNLYQAIQTGIILGVLTHTTKI